MKKTDIALLVFIASMSMMISYFVGNALLGGVQDRAVTVKTAEPISTQVTDPDKKVFNNNAINPTVPVTIGKDSANATDEQDNR